MKTSEIRQRFLAYFMAQGHQQVRSSSVVGPSNDPTVLWTNSGMIQFKDVFVGRDKRPYTKATSSQKCLRAGGKHNDLDQVGFTARHHTFFEMLGNFSFGDYFKKEAIHYAWSFLTQPPAQGGLGLDPKDLWITVFGGEEGIPADDEAVELWKKVGVDPKRIMACGKKDNFWQMGDTGACGPCSEIHFDRGPAFAGDDVPNGQGDRVIEIWNLVFIQYERDAQGKLAPLPQKSIDTGMGLERVASILQKVNSNYEIDLFEPIFETIWKLSHLKSKDEATVRIASQVIADHARAATFMVADGVVPSNEGRGYVLRKIVRRALRFGKHLKMPEGFFAQLPHSVSLAMHDAYPELEAELGTIQNILAREEKQFEQTLFQGLKILEGLELSGSVLSGTEVFKLYDTYGFPLDLVEDWCRERNLKVDLEGFQKELAAQRTKSKSHTKAAQGSTDHHRALMSYAPTQFVGYTTLESESSVLGMMNEQYQSVTTLQGKGFIVLDTTPFYPQGGGQVGDQGLLKFNGGFARVTDTTSPADKRILHQVEVEGILKVGENVTAQVDQERRSQIRAHHTATHLLHAALRDVLGPHVKQAGSVVDADRLRFDFTHYAPLDREQIDLIEQSMNEQCLASLPAHLEEISMDQAMAKGAMALFGEKYGEQVRVLTLGDYSIELCGGTHVNNTGEIGFIKIIQESSVASGVRRVEAVAGKASLRYMQISDSLIHQLSRLANVNRENLVHAFASRDTKIQALEQEVKRSKLQSARNGSQEEDVSTIGNTRLVCVESPGLEGSILREMMDSLKQRHPQSVIVLASSLGDHQVTLMVSVDPALAWHANDLLKVSLPSIQGKGGGKKDMAQGAGSQSLGLPDAIEAIKKALG